MSTVSGVSNQASAATAASSQPETTRKPRLTNEQSTAVANTIIALNQRGASLEERNEAVKEQTEGFRKANAEAAQKNNQAATTATSNQPETAQKPERANTLAKSVTDTIAAQIKKGASREEISAAIEKEVDRFETTRMEVAQSGQGGSSLSKNDLQLLRIVADRFSRQDDPQFLALAEALSKFQSTPRGQEAPSQQPTGSQVDLVA